MKIAWRSLTLGIVQSIFKFFSIYHNTNCFFEDEGQPQRQDWLTGGKGLNMNYLVIFTEIRFYPETSVLLQIIANNSYDNLDYARIRQRRVGSLPVLAPRRQTR